LLLLLSGFVYLAKSSGITVVRPSLSKVNHLNLHSRLVFT